MKISVILLALYCCLLFNAVAQTRPNIIIIVSDNHAFQSINAYGSKLMQILNIDRIAKEGVHFDKAFATSSICGPRRAGKYSHKNGFKDDENAWIGKWHLESKPGTVSNNIGMNLDIAPTNTALQKSKFFRIGSFAERSE